MHGLPNVRVMAIHHNPASVSPLSSLSHTLCVHNPPSHLHFFSLSLSDHNPPSSPSLFSLLTHSVCKCMYACNRCVITIYPSISRRKAALSLWAATNKSRVLEEPKKDFSFGLFDLDWDTFLQVSASISHPPSSHPPPPSSSSATSACISPPPTLSDTSPSHLSLHTSHPFLRRTWRVTYSDAHPSNRPGSRRPSAVQRHSPPITSHSSAPSRGYAASGRRAASTQWE